MKRWVVFLLVVLVLAVLSPACGPTPAPEIIVLETSVPEVVVVETLAVEVVTEVVEVPVEGPQETILFMTWASTSFERAAIERMIEQFEADNPQIAVERTIVR